MQETNNTLSSRYEGKAPNVLTGSSQDPLNQTPGSHCIIDCCLSINPCFILRPRFASPSCDMPCSEGGLVVQEERL
jgi:hypothetical protein